MADCTRDNLEDLSDAGLRELLTAYSITQPVTPSTRSLLIRKLRRQMSAESRQDDTTSQTLASPVAAQLARPTEDGPQAGVDGTLYYGSKAEALVAVKSLPPGVRFTIVSESPSAAASLTQASEVELTGFTLQTHEGQSDITTDVAVATLSEKANRYSSVKTQDLSRLRKLIEEGKAAEFADIVWDNPRHLITSGDTPEILQIPTRSNALHCGASQRQLPVCKEVIAIIESSRFWELIYPDDSHVTRVKRRDHLIDLYLNMQDKINNDTPLHIASRFGYDEIVSFLVTQPSTDRDIRNRDGETAMDVVCRRAKDRTSGLDQRIKQLLKDPDLYYVPVIRATDNSLAPYLGSPCKMEGHEQQSTEERETLLSSPVIGHALAGPMSQAKAHEVYRQWRSPTSSADRRQASVIKRSDPDRGWERIGRSIAQSRGVGWREYWEFLGCYCDLAQPEGLMKLENHLSLMAESDHHQTPLNNALDSLVSDNVANQINDQEDTEDIFPTCTKQDTDNDLLSAIAGLTLGASEDTEMSGEEAMVDQESSSLSSPHSDVVGAGFMTPLRGTGHTIMAPSHKVYITGLSPCKLDHDVFLALGDHTAINPTIYPHVHRWTQLILSHTEEEQTRWSTPRGIKTTPHRTTRPHQSPLVFSTPPSSFSPSSRLPLSSAARHSATPLLRTHPPVPILSLDSAYNNNNI